jgi:EAL domain-containing protein (putative c-di-GMP-specific phosphodiesterase class I)
MLTTNDYLAILNAVWTPIAVISPLLDKNGHITDFYIEYANRPCIDITYGVVRTGRKLKECESLIGPQIRTFELGVKALTSKTPTTVSFKVPGLKNGFSLNAYRTVRNFCVLTVTTAASRENSGTDFRPPRPRTVKSCRPNTRTDIVQNKLAAAVIEKDFELYFQPQFTTRGNELRGFEALLRWHDEELGWIPPDVFIPLAEKTKLIVRLGWWVIENAAATLKKWQTVYGFKGILSVNVSPVQLREPEFADALSQLLLLHKLKNGSFELEITESTLIDTMAQTSRLLSDIREKGVSISLDDFGTGYSFFTYLQQLPVDTLKIDKSFITDMTAENQTSAHITDTIINLGKKLGLETIAEGVETTEQLELLKTMGCNVVQGFLRGRPMDQQHCEALLTGNR